MKGEVKARFTLAANGPSLIEICGGEWHNAVFHALAAVALEVKPGPYEPEFDKEFAEWAPMEGDPTATLFSTWLEQAPTRCGMGRSNRTCSKRGQVNTDASRDFLPIITGVLWKLLRPACEWGSHSEKGRAKSNRRPSPYALIGQRSLARAKDGIILKGKVPGDQPPPRNQLLW
jgi:hypothetical protein